MREGCKLTDDQFTDLGLEMQFIPNTFKKIYKALGTTCSLLEENSSVTHSQIFRKVDSILCLYYEKMLEKHSNHISNSIKDVYLDKLNLICIRYLRIL